jgi:hypothetical protein
MNKFSYSLRRITMGILSGNPKEEPIHYGEVFDIWASQLVGNSLLQGIKRC